MVTRTRSAEELFKRGYYPISNRYTMVARVDREDWVEHLANQSFRSVADFYIRTVDGRLSTSTGHWGEHYCRCYSKDRIEGVPQDEYKKLKTLWNFKYPTFVKPPVTPVRPPCYNRPPRADGQWMQVGYRQGKAVWRWFPRWSEDRCAVHDGTGIGPNGENYPSAHNWSCAGCRWNPIPKGDYWLSEHGLYPYQQEIMAAIENRAVPILLRDKIRCPINFAENNTRFAYTSGDPNAIPAVRRYVIVDEINNLNHEVMVFSGEPFIPTRKDEQQQ